MMRELCERRYVQGRYKKGALYKVVWVLSDWRDRWSFMGLLTIFTS